MLDKKTPPTFPIDEENYVNDKMKKKYEEIKARKDRKVVSLRKKGK